MDVCEIPFSKELGVQRGDNASDLVLTPDTRHLNHVGTVHAGVIYSFAEIVAGQTLIDQFPELVGKAVPLLRSAQARYRSPAIPGESLHGSGSVDETAASVFREELSEKGRALVEVKATLQQGERKIVGATYSFFVSMTGN